MLLLLMLLMLLLLMLDWSRGHETAAAIPARMQIQPGEDQDEAGPDADAPHGASGILQRLGSPQRGHPAPPVLRERPPSAGLRPSRPQSRPHPDGSPRSGHRQAIHGPARQFHDLWGHEHGGGAALHHRHGPPLRFQRIHRQSLPRLPSGRYQKIQTLLGGNQNTNQLLLLLLLLLLPHQFPDGDSPGFSVCKCYVCSADANQSIR